ncbi:hypothetical protein JCM4814A_94520 [Streptomyces phaeofaciens JCM 4814]|uniref:Uncharacterized protein n=1 Tax=Streptomyces phaeofaciens TaxID=68254 RepID=A0A918M1Q5_9ACTN|nr:hypothetical protein GCM10010226_88260 [Streptomyces phaeofaciens]
MRSAPDPSHTHGIDFASVSRRCWTGHMTIMVIRSPVTLPKAVAREIPSHPPVSWYHLLLNGRRGQVRYAQRRGL